jgi:hypothetical protein
LGFHLSLLSSWWFSLVTAVSGVLFALGLAILSVYAGVAISKPAQELCFLLALAAAPLGAIAHLFFVRMAEGDHSAVAAGHGAAVAADDATTATAAAAAAGDLPNVRGGGPSAYLSGLLLSASFSLFTLCFNKRPAALAGAGGGGFIPGRDEASASAASGGRKHKNNGTDSAFSFSNNGGGGLDTPQVVSPAAQYSMRRKL